MGGCRNLVGGDRGAARESGTWSGNAMVKELHASGSGENDPDEKIFLLKGYDEDHYGVVWPVGKDFKV